jgi:hypothetical protein
VSQVPLGPDNYASPAENQLLYVLYTYVRGEPLILVVEEGNAGLGGAYLGAVAAVGAKIGIDDIDRVADCDRLFRAFRQAGVAQDTVTGNNVCQLTSLASAPTKIDP